MNQSPKILYVTQHWPHRSTCASELRSLYIARALKNYGDLDIYVVDTEERKQEWIESDCKEFRVIGSCPVCSFPNKRIIDKVRWLIDPRLDYPHGWGVLHKEANELERIEAGYDLIWISKLRTANLIPKDVWKRTFVDIDDVPSTYEESVCKMKHSLLGSVAASARLWSWKRRDRRLGDRFSSLGVCSELDKKYLQSIGIDRSIHVIPNGFEVPKSEPLRAPMTHPRIGFVGIFDYEPNRQGVQWFAENCWPIIKGMIPDAELRLVGRLSDGELKPLGSDIEGLGWIEDVESEIATWSAMIVPIHLGAGTRGKIAHAFSQKCPIISTSLGAYGYEPVNGREMRIADTALEFADACIDVVCRKEEARLMAQRAWDIFVNNYTWKAINSRILAAVEECLRFVK